MLKFLAVILVVKTLSVVPSYQYESKIPNDETPRVHMPIQPNETELESQKSQLSSEPNVSKAKVHPVLHLDDDYGLDTKSNPKDAEPVVMVIEWTAESGTEIKNGEEFDGIKKEPGFELPKIEMNLDTKTTKVIPEEVRSKTYQSSAATHVQSHSKTSRVLSNFMVVVIAGLLGVVLALICFWCFLLCAAVRAQNDYYAPQTFRQQQEGFQRGLFAPEKRDGTPQGTSQSWTPIDNKESWKAPLHTNTKAEPWRLPYGISKEQQASILHHKQALTSEGAFRYEYASDNGLAVGEQIEPDGSRVGAYQYKDPSGQLVKLKYRAGKEGFQILEGSHLPKSPEPVAPQIQDNHYQSAYAQQRQQYELQQQYNQQRPEQNQNSWRDEQGPDGQKSAGGQYFVQNTNWRPQGGAQDDGQYRENELENKGPHSFGEGYAFAFKG